MTNLALLCAILLSSFSPCATLPDEAVKEAIAIHSEEGILVAVIPEAASSYEEKSSALRSYAEKLSKRYALPVILTEDLRTYMSLERMMRRGTSPYERDRLLSRREAIAKYGIAVWTEREEDSFLFSCKKERSRI